MCVSVCQCVCVVVGGGDGGGDGGGQRRLDRAQLYEFTLSSILQNVKNNILETRSSRYSNHIMYFTCALPIKEIDQEITWAVKVSSLL